MSLLYTDIEQVVKMFCPGNKNPIVIILTGDVLVMQRAVESATTVLTLKHRETHGCIVSTVTTDALVLKHQAISIHNAD